MVSRMIATARKTSAMMAVTPGPTEAILSRTKLSVEWLGSRFGVISKCSAKCLRARSLVFMDVENLGLLSRSSLVLPVASLLNVEV